MTHRFKTGLYLVSGLLFISTQGFCDTGDTLRDPTQPEVVDMAPLGVNEKEAKDYKLQSIIIDPTRRLALINDNFVMVGDKVGLATVVSIDKNTVVLSLYNKNITLYLFDLRTWQ